jgi:hypothetical protein
LVWDGITRKGTVQNIAVLKEQIRGEGASVRISLAYADGTSSQAEEMLRKVDGEWKLSFMGLTQASIVGLFNRTQTNQGHASTEPFTRVTQQRASVPSKQNQDLRTPTAPNKPALPDNDPPVQRKGDELKLAMEKLDEFQKTGDEATRLRIARELAEMSKAWTKDESSQVIESVAKLGPAGKPLALLLCRIIANERYTLSRGALAKSALAALENVHPDLYQPVVVITMESRLGSSYEQATKKLAALGDKAVAPILLKHLREGVQRAESGSGPFSYRKSAFTGCMEALVAIERDEPTTFQAVLAVANAWAKANDSRNRGAKNFSYDNLPITLDAIKILSSFGPKAKDAIPVLKQLKLDENESVRKAAWEALKQIDANE